jgi:hypothetical protein
MRTSRITLYTVMAALLALAQGANAQGQLTIGQTPVPAFANLGVQQEAVFEQVPSVPSGPGTLLINGDPVSQAQFPTVFRMTTGGTCTATLVGEAAMLTAAHCVAHGALIRFVLGTRQVRSLCERAPGYNPPFNPSEDWAVCLLEFPVAGIKYETVDDPGVPADGTKVHLTGYGCTAQGGGIDGLLRIGESILVSRPPDFGPETSTLYTASSVAAGGAVLCPGDSGGPLFILAGNSPNDARTLVGVNSRTTFQFGVSFFAATGSPSGRLFLADWAERHGQEICGLNLADANRCR